VPISCRVAPSVGYMTTSETYHSDPDQQQQQQQHNHDSSHSENVPRSSGRRLSFEHHSLTSDGGGRRSFSSSVQPVVEGASAIEKNWEGRDLSRRGNIHRSHLSSSIQTGTGQLSEES
jgi:hypothetical protein